MKSNHRSRPYQICSNCVMDTSASGLQFDAQGWCDYCRNFHADIKPNWRTDEVAFQELLRQAEVVRAAGKSREHDCVLGISGGVDSSYMAYLAKEVLGLRPLIFHCDAGWNSQEAVNNIERLVDGLNLDLHTEVVNWDEMRDLQLAFFKAQVPNLDIPQDHAFQASLYNFAAKHDFKFILNGGNYSTECVRDPLEWAYHASDLRHLEDVHAKFGTRPLTTFPKADILKYKIYYRYIKGVRVLRPLNSVPFIKADAAKFLTDRFGWQSYPHKHYESRFTRFFEGHWQPRKFGYDKRRAHFSSLILTGQMTRDDALQKLSGPAYDPEQAAQDFSYVATKLGLKVSELEEIMRGPNRTHADYKTAMPVITAGVALMRGIGVQRAIIR